MRTVYCGGHLMKEARLGLGLSMHECSRKTTFTPFEWHQYENGRHQIADEYLTIIADVLNINPTSLSEENKKTRFEPCHRRTWICCDLDI